MFNTNDKMPRTLRHIIEYFLNRDHFNTSICHLLKELANRFQLLSVLLYYYICPILSYSICFRNIRCSSSQIPFCAKSNACPFIHKFKISFLSLAKSTVSKETAFPLLLLLYDPTIAKGFMITICTIVMRHKNKDNFYSHQRLKTYVFWQLIYRPCLVIPKTEFQLIN